MNNKPLLILSVILCVVMLLIGCSGTPAYSDPPKEAKPAEIVTEPVAQIQEEEPEPIEEVKEVEPTPPPAPKVQTIGEIFIQTKNWDADAEIDGIEFSLNPKDVNDRSVKAPGKISIILWKSLSSGFDSVCAKRDTDILETWTDIPVTEENYDLFGAKIRAEYKEYEITIDEFAQGCIEITFTTPDGKSFKSFDDTVYINGI